VPGSVVRGLARCYLELAQSDRTALLLRDWLVEHADDGLAWLLQAKAALAQGDLLNARRSAETAVQLAPGSAQGHLVHGYACWRQGLREKARHALEQALELDPNDAIAHCLLGQVLSETGRRDEAAGHWIRVLELDPDSTWARRGLDRIGARPPDTAQLASEF
jgi:tetratricopeptide (TPR) repeat protein